MGLRDTRRTLRHELDRMALVILATSHGSVAQRSQTASGQRAILNALEHRGPVPLACQSVQLGARDSFKSYSHYEKLIWLTSRISGLDR
jgi:hypothetical protein